jgi:hypothetical protein
VTATNNCDANFFSPQNWHTSNQLPDIEHVDVGFLVARLVASGAAALSVASMTLGDIDVTFVAGMALADIDVTFNFVWQACHLWHLLALGWDWRRGLLRGRHRRSLREAGVALGGIDVYFVWALADIGAHFVWQE